MIAWNVAFKLNWLYGQYGPFTTACTAEGREINIRLAKRVWCRHPECPCYQVWSRGNEGPPLADPPCFEAEMLRRCGFGAGTYRQGSKKGEPIPIRHAQAGKWAFLTARRHDMSEAERIVIGCYRIASVKPHQKWSSFFVYAEAGSELMVRDFAKAPRFWDYHRQPKGPFWGSGLFRYLADEEAVALRHAIEKTVRGRGE